MVSFTGSEISIASVATAVAAIVAAGSMLRRPNSGIAVTGAAISTGEVAAAGTIRSVSNPEMTLPSPSDRRPPTNSDMAS